MKTKADIIYDKLMEYSTENVVEIEETNDMVRNIKNAISQLYRNQINYSFKPMNDSSKLKIFIKKVIRKIVKFYVDPISQQQTQFNCYTTIGIEGTLKETIRIDGELNEVKVLVEEEKSSHEQMNKQLQEEYQNLQSQYNLLNEKMEFVNAQMEKIAEAGIFSMEKQSEWDKKTYSQSGEDSIVLYVLRVIGKNYEQVTYLDLGANHAKELSNTYSLYCNGARGVLVEANPELIPELKLNRPGDVILNKCVSENKDAKLPFYILNGDGLSSCDKEAVEEAIRINPALHIEKEVLVDSISVKQIIEKYFDGAPTVLNIDIEGQEIDILKAMDLSVVRPTIIICEMIDYSLFINNNQKNPEILQFMKDNHYVEYAYTGINSIFVDENVWA